jgi:hypothetical protein
MLGVADEEYDYEYGSEYNNESMDNSENEALAAGYFTEDSEEDFEESEELYYQNSNSQECNVSFFNEFSDALSSFISSGALNVILDLTTGTSKSSPDSKKNDNETRNNSGSRNYGGRDR